MRTGRELIIELRGGQDGLVTAVAQLSGESSLEGAARSSEVTVRLPPAEAMLTSLEWSRRSGGASLSRAYRLASDDGARDVGATLFRALFDGTLGLALRAARGRGGALRLTLILNGEGVAEYPWETLWDPGQETAVFRLRGSNLIRGAVNSPRPTSALTRPFRLLAVVCPPPMGDSAIEAELDAIRRLSAREVAAWTVEELRPIGARDLVERVGAGGYDALHFMGSAYIDGERRTGLAIGIKGSGTYEGLDLSRLVAALPTANPPRMITLNACSSSRIAAELSSRVPDVWGVSGAIDSSAAGLFGTRFFEAIAGGASFAGAVAAARLAVVYNANTWWRYQAWSVEGAGAWVETLDGADQPVEPELVEPPPNLSRQRAIIQRQVKICDANLAMLARQAADQRFPPSWIAAARADEERERDRLNNHLKSAD